MDVKCQEAIKYIYHTLKLKDAMEMSAILYFADLYHLNNYGRFIGDKTYIANSAGIKVRNLNIAFSEDFTVNFEQFSISDLQALDYAMLNIFVDAAKDSVWHYVSASGKLITPQCPEIVIPNEVIIKSLKDGDDILKYLQG